VLFSAPSMRIRKPERVWVGGWILRPVPDDAAP